MSARSAAALPAVLLCLACVGALTVGGAYVTRRAASNARLEAQLADLDAEPELGLIESLTTWDSLARADQLAGTTERLTVVTTPSKTGVWVTRLSNMDYWLVAERCRQEVPAICRRVGVIVRSISDSVAIIYGRGWSELP